MGVLEMISGLGIFTFIFGIIALVISILTFVFWIVMIIDCVKRKFKEETEKIVWILVLIFTGFIGALIYYFIVKRKNKK